MTAEHHVEVCQGYWLTDNSSQECDSDDGGYPATTVDCPATAAKDGYCLVTAAKDGDCLATAVGCPATGAKDSGCPATAAKEDGEYMDVDGWSFAFWVLLTKDSCLTEIGGLNGNNNCNEFDSNGEIDCNGDGNGGVDVNGNGDGN